jgi:26S proteasome regulatory subunit N9
LAHVIKQFKDKRSAINFLEKTEPKVKSNKEAVALCKVLIGQILLDELNIQDEAKKIIEDVETMLDTTDGVTTVHGRFYLLASRLYRLQGKHAEYYRTALR